MIHCTRLFIAVSMLLVSCAVSAQNLVPNPDFDAGTAHWTAVVPPPVGHDATIAINHAIGRASAPSLQVSLVPGASVARAVSECIAIDPAMDYVLKVFGHADNPDSVAKAYVRVYRNEVAPCDGDRTLYSSTSSSLDQGWVLLERDLPSWGFDPTAGHVRVVLEVGLSGPQGATLQASFDAVRFGLKDSLPVTLQSFRVE